MEMVKESKEAVPIPAIPLLSNSASFLNREAESNDTFNQSLSELKELRSQLYHAADHCENAFLKASQKKIVVENTKTYICEAIVTVIDHLGTVSSNIEQQMHRNIKLSQAELGIDCLKQAWNQRLLTCQQYVVSLDLSTLQWSTKFPRNHRRYVKPFPQNYVKSSSVRDIDFNVRTTPCRKVQFMASAAESPVIHDGIELAAAVPVCEGQSTLSKSWNPPFGSPKEDILKLVCSDQKKKTFHGSNFLAFLTKSRRRI